MGPFRAGCDNETTGEFPGQPIRSLVEDAPRHQPASRQQWLKSHSIDGGALVPKPSAAVAPKPKKSQESTGNEVKLATAPEKCENTWSGDRPCAAIVSCCEWHRQQAKNAGSETFLRFVRGWR